MLLSKKKKTNKTRVTFAGGQVGVTGERGSLT